jgi:hypothetical protein
MHPVGVFSIACASASIASVVPKWRTFSFIFKRGNRKVGRMGDDSQIVLAQKYSSEKECVTR